MGKFTSSRAGMDSTRPFIPAASSSSHFGTPRPFTASTEAVTCAFLAARGLRLTTLPSSTW